MCVEIASGTPFEMFPYNPNSYTEAQWMPSTMASVPGFEYDSGAAYSHPSNNNHHHHHHHQQSHQQQQAQHHDPHHQQAQQGQASRRPPNIEVSTVPSHMIGNGRPKSSPGSFDNNADEASQYHHAQQQSPQQPQPQRQQQQQQPPQQQNQQHQTHEDASRYAMGSYSYPSASLPLSPPTSTTAYLHSDLGPTMGPAASSLTRASPVPIAPNPTDARNLKRKRTTSTPERPPELTEEEKLLLKLKEDENLPWKDIAVRFQQDIGKTYQVPALQMRFKRLRERIRLWTENDIQALEQAYEYWEKHQFEIIATKMLDFGCPERFPPKAVQRKWEELHHDRLASQQSAFPFAGANSAAAFAATTYPGPHGILPSQHGFVRHLSVGPGPASGISPFHSPRGPVGAGQYLYGGQPAGAQPLLSPAPGSVAASAAASVYGTSPLIPPNNKFSGLVGPSHHQQQQQQQHQQHQQQHQQQQQRNAGNSARSASIPTPRSAGASPGPFAATDDTAVAAGTTSITEVGGVNMGLGLGLSMSPSMASESMRAAGAGRQRSFSSMH